MKQEGVSKAGFGKREEKVMCRESLEFYATSLQEDLFLLLLSLANDPELVLTNLIHLKYFD